MIPRCTNIVGFIIIIIPLSLLYFVLVRSFSISIISITLLRTTVITIIIIINCTSITVHYY